MHQQLQSSSAAIFRRRRIPSLRARIILTAGGSTLSHAVPCTPDEQSVGRTPNTPSGPNSLSLPLPLRITEWEVIRLAILESFLGGCLNATHVLEVKRKSHAARNFATGLFGVQCSGKKTGWRDLLIFFSSLNTEHRTLNTRSCDSNDAFEKGYA